MITLIENALTTSECEALITRMSAGFQGCGSAYPPSYRTNDRQVIDDPTLAATLQARLTNHLPARHRGGRLVGINSRLRGCRYQPGQRFSRHLDGIHHRSDTVRSALTFMIYLNDASEFSGGDTRFFASRTSQVVTHRITPAPGTLVIFDHDLWHDGAEVTSGVKFILRSDLLYEFPTQPTVGHRGYIWAIQPLADGTVATGGRDTTIRIWRGSRCVATLPGHDLSVTALAEDARGRLWSGSRDGTVRIWTKHHGEWRLSETQAAHDGAVLRLLAGPDGMVSSGADGTVRCGTKTWQTGQGWVWDLAWAADGGLLTAGEDGRVCHDGETILHSDAPVWSVAVMPDGAVVAGDAAGRIHHRGVVLPAHTGGVRALLALADGRLLSGGEDSTVRLWGQTVVEHADFVTALALTGGALLSASYDGSLRRTSLAALSPERTAPSMKPVQTSAVSVPAQ
ncbi:MAG: WD40 repeat protein [Myxococcota bacterium]|jgi:WD40 repeat protein